MSDQGAARTAGPPIWEKDLRGQDGEGGMGWDGMGGSWLLHSTASQSKDKNKENKKTGGGGEHFKLIG